MTTRYATALSYILLTGSSLFCFLSYGTEDFFSYAHAIFGSIILNSALGVFRWGNPLYGIEIEGCYRIASILQACTALPFFTSFMLLKYEIIPTLIYFNLMLSYIPLLLYLLHKEHRDLLNVTICINSIIIGIISYWYENYFGVSASLSYAFNHFVIGDEGDFFNIMPSVDLYNYGLCFCVIFFLKAILLI